MPPKFKFFFAPPELWPLIFYSATQAAASPIKFLVSISLSLSLYRRVHLNLKRTRSLGHATIFADPTIVAMSAATGASADGDEHCESPPSSAAARRSGRG